MSETITTTPPRVPPGPEWGRTIEPAEVLRLGRLIAQAEASFFYRSDERVSFARMFCTSIVEVLWNGVLARSGSVWPLPALFVPMAGLPKSLRLNPLAVAMGDAAGALDLQSASYAVGTVYASLLPDRQRCRSSPPARVRRLLDMAACAGVDFRTCSVCDPACGAGAFLVPIAALMAEVNSQVPPRMFLRSLSHRLRGWDIDPFAAWLAQVFLELLLRDVCRSAGSRLPFLAGVHGGPSRMQLEREFDVVIGNPPYDPVALLPELRRRYRRRS